MKPLNPSSHVLTLDPAASSFLDMMVDLGHLDERMLSTLNDQLLELVADDGHVPLEEIRRLVATLVFEHMDETEPEYKRMLEGEWSLLFC